MYQHVKENTRYRAGSEPSLLDLLLTNEENMVNSVSYMPGLGKSDHMQLMFTFNCYTETSQTVFTKLNFFKGNYTGLSKELAHVDWLQLLAGVDLSAS